MLDTPTRYHRKPPRPARRGRLVITVATALLLLAGGGAVAVLVAASWLGLPGVAAGLAARSVCSAIHVAGRDPAAVIREDLEPAHPLSGWIDVRPDRGTATVTARLGWFAPRTAHYLAPFGCVLDPAAPLVAAASSPPVRDRVEGAAGTNGDERFDYAGLEDAGIQGAGLDHASPDGSPGYAGIAAAPPRLARGLGWRRAGRADAGRAAGDARPARPCRGLCPLGRGAGDAVEHRRCRPLRRLGTTPCRRAAISLRQRRHEPDPGPAAGQLRRRCRLLALCRGTAVPGARAGAAGAAGRSGRTGAGATGAAASASTPRACDHPGAGSAPRRSRRGIHRWSYAGSR